MHVSVEHKKSHFLTECSSFSDVGWVTQSQFCPRTMNGWMNFSRADSFWWQLSDLPPYFSCFLLHKRMKVLKHRGLFSLSAGKVWQIREVNQSVFLWHVCFGEISLETRITDKQTNSSAAGCSVSASTRLRRGPVRYLQQRAAWSFHPKVSTKSLFAPFLQRSRHQLALIPAIHNYFIWDE